MKRNQIMITALAIMIAVAGYLNFAGFSLDEETLVIKDEVLEEEMALLDLSEEDIVSDIESLDEEAKITENYLEEDMQIVDVDTTVDLSANQEEELESPAVELAKADTGQQIQEEEESIEGTPGEAVFTSSKAITTLSAAKLLKEQTRAKNREALTEIVNNEALEAAQKQEAVDDMVAMAEMSEKEMEAEILLSAKGFQDSVVSISNEGVDVMICAETLTDAQLAQIMDIVSRKTEIGAEQIIIATVSP